MCYWQWNNSSPLPCTVDGAPMKELWSNFFPSIFIFPLVWYSILSDKLDGVNQLVLLLCTHIPINIILWIIQVLKKMNKVMSMCFEFQYFSCDGWQILVEKKTRKRRSDDGDVLPFFLPYHLETYLNLFDFWLFFLIIGINMSEENWVWYTEGKMIDWYNVNAVKNDFSIEIKLKQINFFTFLYQSGFFASFANPDEFHKARHVNSLPIWCSSGRIHHNFDNNYHEHADSQ